MVELPEDVYNAAISPRQSTIDGEGGDEDESLSSLADTIRLLALQQPDDVMDPSEVPTGRTSRRNSYWLSESQESLAVIQEEGDEHDESQNTHLLKEDSLNNSVDNEKATTSGSQRNSQSNGVIVKVSIENDVGSPTENTEGSIEFIDNISNQGSKSNVSVSVNA